MNIDQLKQQFPTEDSCRNFFEAIIWPEGRICPHGSSKKILLLTEKLLESAFINAVSVTGSLA